MTGKKSLKVIEMPKNCGIEALSQLTELKNISAFTLVHAARDNGLNLFVFKVQDLNDLAKVQRPAIFHQEGHFVYIKNGEALPQGKYTGYVLGKAVLGRVIGLQEAKFIKGGKKGGGGFLGSILGIVGSIVGNIILPGIGGAIGGALGGLAGGSLGGDKGLNLGLDAIQGGATGLSGNAGVVGNIAKGAATLAGGIHGYSNGGGIGGAALGALGGYGGASLTGAAEAGSAAAGGSFLNQLGGAGKGALGAIGIGHTASGVNNLATNAGNFSNVSSAGINQGANAVNAFGAGNFASSASSPAMSLIGDGVGTAAGQASPFNLSLPSTGSPVGSTGVNFGGGGSAPSTGSCIAGVGGGLLSKVGGIGGAASIAGGVGLLGSKAPAYNAATPQANYSALNTFVGQTAQGKLNNQAGQAATQGNIDYVNTPISQLQQQFTANNSRTLNTINTAYDNQRNQLTHQFAQAGQTLANSQELQTKVGQLEQQRTNDLTLAQQEAQDQALSQAVSVKQQALSQSMQAGQFNQTLAMELAGLTGDQQNLQYAIANNDYQSFQQIMGKLLTMGIPQSVNIVNNGQQSTMTRTGGL